MSGTFIEKYGSTVAKVNLYIIFIRCSLLCTPTNFQRTSLELMFFSENCFYSCIIKQNMVKQSLVWQFFSLCDARGFRQIKLTSKSALSSSQTTFSFLSTYSNANFLSRVSITCKETTKLNASQGICQSSHCIHSGLQIIHALMHKICLKWPVNDQIGRLHLHHY